MYEMSRIGRSIETDSRLVIAMGLQRGGQWGVTANEYGVSFGDDNNVLELERIIVQPHEYPKIYRIEHFSEFCGF